MEISFEILVFLKPVITHFLKIEEHWNGIVGDLVAGSADMSFAPLSVSK